MSNTNVVITNENYQSYLRGDFDNESFITWKTTKPITFLSSKLKKLICSGNGLKRLPFLPYSLTFLDCSDNQLVEEDFPKLPESLKTFHCSKNNWKVLPRLSNYLTKLDCSQNKLEGLLSPLPATLTYLNCSDNQLNCIGVEDDNLPYLKYLDCSNNDLEELYFEGIDNKQLDTFIYHENPLHMSEGVFIDTSVSFPWFLLSILLSLGLIYILLP